MTDQDRELTMGHIIGPWGVAGWVRIHSLTDPPENIFKYQPWRSDRAPGLFSVEKWRRHGNGLVCALSGVPDRNAAERLAGAELRVSTSRLPRAEPGHWYWHELIGLQVINHRGQVLGKVVGLIETGANDVLRVQPEDGTPELLIPFVMDVYVQSVDLARRALHVEWEIDWSRGSD